RRSHTTSLAQRPTTTLSTACGLHWRSCAIPLPCIWIILLITASPARISSSQMSICHTRCRIPPSGLTCWRRLPMSLRACRCGTGPTTTTSAARRCVSWLMAGCVPSWPPAAGLTRATLSAATCSRNGPSTSTASTPASLPCSTPPRRPSSAASAITSFARATHPS
ncbi:hypothetical protein IWW38_001982, partial [Coemansia aciculifera]